MLLPRNVFIFRQFVVWMHAVAQVVILISASGGLVKKLAFILRWALLLGVSSTAAFAKTGQDAFGVTAAVLDTIGVTCDPRPKSNGLWAKQVSFGVITRGHSYEGGGTVTVTPTRNAIPTTSDPHLILLGGGGPLVCTVTGMSNLALSSLVLSGGGGTTKGSSLIGVRVQGRSSGNYDNYMSADLTTAIESTEAAEASAVIIGGVLTLKASYANSADEEAWAGSYMTEPITLTVTD